MKANHVITTVAVLCLASTTVAARQSASKPIYKEIQKVITARTENTASLTLDSFGYPNWTIAKGLNSKDRTQLVPCNINSTVSPASVVLKRNNPFNKHHDEVTLFIRHTVV